MGKIEGTGRREGFFHRGAKEEKGQPEKYETIVRQIGNKKIDRRFAAIAALGDLDDRRAVEPAKEALHDPVRIVRLAAVRSLSKLNEKKSVPPLAKDLTKLLTDPSLDVRVEAITALQELPTDKSILPSLTESIAPYTGRDYDRWREDYFEDLSPEAFSYEGGKKRIRKENWDPKTYENSKEEVDKKLHQLELATIAIAENIGNPDAIAFIEDTFTKKYGDPVVEVGCLDALHRLRAPAPKKLIDAVDLDTSSMDWSDLHEIGGDHHHVEETLRNRTKGLEPLARFTYDEPVATLFEEALSHDQPQIKTAAARYLGETHDENVLPLLTEAVKEIPIMYSVSEREEGVPKQDALFRTEVQTAITKIQKTSHSLKKDD